MKPNLGPDGFPIVPMQNGEPDFAAMDAAVARRRKRRIRIILFGPPLVLLLLALLSLGVYRLHLRLALRAEMKAARAAGLPLTYDELNAWHAGLVPDGKPAEAQLHACMMIRGALQVDEKDQESASAAESGRISWDALPTAVALSVRSYLVQNAEALAALRALRPEVGAYYALSIPFNRAFMERQNQVLAAMDLLAVAALDDEARGDGEGITRDLLATLTVADPLRYDGARGPNEIRMDALDRVVSVLEHALARTSLTEPQLGKLETGLAKFDEPELLERVILGEFGRMNAALAAHRSNWYRLVADVQRQDPSAKLGNLTLLRITGASDEARRTLLRIGMRYLEVARSPAPARPPSMQILLAETLKSGCSADALLSMLRWDFGNLFERAAFDLARFRTARTAIAVERYRLAKGEFPHKLEALVPEYLDAVPADPYDGKPLRYLPESRSFKVYSVGWDRVDNDGWPWKPQIEGGDITFEVKPPAATVDTDAARR